MGLLIICFAVTNPIPLHPKIVKTKVWDLMFSVKNIFWKRLLDACSAVHTNTIERNSSKYRVDAKRMYREYTR